MTHTHDDDVKTDTCMYCTVGMAIFVLLEPVLALHADDINAEQLAGELDFMGRGSYHKDCEHWGRDIDTICNHFMRMRWLLSRLTDVEVQAIYSIASRCPDTGVH